MRAASLAVLITASILVSCFAHPEPAVIKPAVIKPAVIKPAVIKPAVAVPQVQRDELNKKAAVMLQIKRRANKWNEGYTKQDSNIYIKKIAASSGKCTSYFHYGCSKYKVITRKGCPSYVAINANEYSSRRNGEIINELLVFQAHGIPAKTARVFELDHSAKGTYSGNVSAECS